MGTFLVVDDHEIVRKGVHMIISDLPGTHRVLQAATCKDMMHCLGSEPVDYIILDLLLPDGSSFSTIEKIQEQSPGSSILVYTMNSERIYAKRLLQKGIQGFVSKLAPVDELAKAIKSMLAGTVFISPALTRKDSFMKEVNVNPIDMLSDRELEVVELVIAGMGIKEISNKMDLDITTVSRFRKRACDKFGVDNNIELKEKFDLYKSM